MTDAVITDEQAIDGIALLLERITPPDAAGKYAVIRIDDGVDPVDIYRHSLSMGSGYIWYVMAGEKATAITGNGPRSKQNAEFYAAAPGMVRWLLAQLTAAKQRAEAAEANARQWEQTAREYSRVQEYTKERAETAEAALAAEPLDEIVLAIANFHEHEEVQRARRSVRDWLDKRMKVHL